MACMKHGFMINITYFILSTSSVGEVPVGASTGFNWLNLTEQGPTVNN